MNLNRLRNIFFIILILIMQNSLPVSAQEDSDPVYQSYVDFFEKVYQTMVDNYFHPPSREKFDFFLEQFRTKI